jgi:hypothetical protein
MDIEEEGMRRMKGYGGGGDEDIELKLGRA